VVYLDQQIEAREPPPYITFSRMAGRIKTTTTTAGFINKYLFVYNNRNLLFLWSGKMRIRKEELYLLVDLVNEKDTKLVYDLNSVVIEKNKEKDIIVEADNSPLTEKEKKILKQAEMDTEYEDPIDWDDFHH
jgi:hypothetical protein